MFIIVKFYQIVAKQCQDALYTVNKYKIVMQITHSLNLFEQLNRKFRGSVAKHVDSDGKCGLALGLTDEIALHARKTSALDSHLATNLQAGGVDGDRSISIANHTLEVKHLAVGNHGDISLSELVLPRPVHNEVQNKLRLTGYGVADIPVAAYEEVAGADSPIHPMAFACTGPLVKFTLQGDVGFKLHITPLTKLPFEFIPTGCFRIGGDNGYEPAVFFHKFKRTERLRHRQVLTTCRKESGVFEPFPRLCRDMFFTVAVFYTFCAL